MTCPVRAWRRWLTESGIETGPAFRSVDRHGRLGSKRLSDRAVAADPTVKDLALELGRTPATVRSWMKAEGIAPYIYAGVERVRKADATAFYRLLGRG